MTDHAADYVIVGAGSAGCVLAGRLSERPDVRVVVLEAGAPHRSLVTRVPALTYRGRATAADWGYVTEPQSALGGRPMYWTRGRGPGGTSLVNAQVWLRAHPTDFEAWPDGDVGWGWPDVTRFYARAEDDRRPGGAGGRGGPVLIAGLRQPNPMTEAFIAGAAELGFRRNSDLVASLDGAGAMPVTQRRGARWSAADAYLRPARHRSNLEIVTGATATRIVFDGQRAVGVDYRRAGSSHHVPANVEVILSAGTVASPQLLLLSGVGPPGHLRDHDIPLIAALPGVGQNLRDHVGVAVRYRTRRRRSLTAAESPASAVRYALARRGPLTSNVVEACLFVVTDPTLPAPDLQLVFAPILYSPALIYATPRRWLAHRVRPHHGCSIFANAQQPRSAGTVELASADPSAPPRIQPATLSDPDGADRNLLVRAVAEARALAATDALARWIEDEVAPGPGVRGEDDVVAFVRRAAHTSNHAVGTCRMGTDDMAVVDPSLRVHGTTHLRVVDASVMPTVPTGHPYATVMMLGERAADLLA